jgi:hypothetical protein
MLELPDDPHRIRSLTAIVCTKCDGIVGVLDDRVNTRQLTLLERLLRALKVPNEEPEQDDEQADQDAEWDASVPKTRKRVG